MESTTGVGVCLPSCTALHGFQRGHSLKSIIIYSLMLARLPGARRLFLCCLCFCHSTALVSRAVAQINLARPTCFSCVFPTCQRPFCLSFFLASVCHLIFSSTLGCPLSSDHTVSHDLGVDGPFRHTQPGPSHSYLLLSRGNLKERQDQANTTSKMAVHRRDKCTPCPFSAGSTYQDVPNVTDPQCFQRTEEAFLGSLLSGQESLTADACHYLKDNDDGGDIFWALYYLDITYCGLAYINGQPNLDRKLQKSDSVKESRR